MPGQAPGHRPTPGRSRSGAQQARSATERRGPPPMKVPKQKWLSTGRLRRTVLMLGVAGATAGAALLTAAGSAQAVTSVGSKPGNLTFNPATGSDTLAVGAVTWSTTDGCPTGFQGSAQLDIIDANGTGVTASPTITAVTSAFSGTLLGTPLALQSTGVPDIPLGTPVAYAVLCASAAGGTGNTKFVQSTDMTINTTTNTYTAGIVTLTHTST